jgi:hypothetical protein
MLQTGRPAAATSFGTGPFSATGVTREPQCAGNPEVWSDQTLLHFQNQDGITKYRGDISTGEGERKEYVKKFM